MHGFIYRFMRGACAAKTALAISVVAGCSVVATFDGLQGPAPGSDAGLDAGDAGPAARTDAGSPNNVTTDGAASDAADASDGAARLDYATVVMADTPELYWRFEDPNAIVDSSGNDHTATTLGTVTLGAKGAIAGGGKGASFASGAISAGQILSFTGNAPFTLEVWALIPNSAYQNFIGRELDPADGYAFFVNGALIFERESAQGVDHATSASNIPTKVYNHLVGTYDGSTMRAYINGVLVATKVSSLALPGAASVPFLAGDNNDAGSGRFTGLLDELAVYDFDLSPATIMRHYQVGIGAL